MTETFFQFISNSRNSKSNIYPRTYLDTALEFFRFAKVETYIPKDVCLLDIGTGDGNFLRYLNGRIRTAVGIDSQLTTPLFFGACRLVPGYFPQDFTENTTFDVITMLASVEHIPMKLLPKVADTCWKHLKPRGQVIITVPHPHVDGLLNLLQTLQLIKGFSLHQHYGFNPESLFEIFKTPSWQLIKRERWGFGYNNLFIFEKCS